MKRDKAGKFAQTWDQESKQAVKLSLTDTAWSLLAQKARVMGISRSELVERQARHVDCSCCMQKQPELQQVMQLEQQLSELQKTIEDLRSQEQAHHWLEAILNLLPTPLILVDPAQMCVTFSNRAANAVAGVDLAKDVGATYNEEYHCTDETGQIIPPEQVPAVRAARGEKFVGTEITWHTPVGVFPLLVHADTIPAMHDRAATSVVVFQDIRERKRLEEQLQENRRFIQQVADATPGILYIYDLLKQRNVYANRQVGEVLGYTVKQVQAMGDRLFPTLMHPDDLATLPAHMERFGSAQDHEVIEREYRMRHANGEWRWFWSRDLVFSKTPTGDPHQVLGISHDITDRKQADLVRIQLYQSEQIARTNAEASEQRFRFLAESIPQIVWVAQEHGFTEYYNQRWFQYTGLTLEESQNANGSFRHPDDHASFESAWTQALNHKEILQVEQRIQRADGTYRWHLTRACPLLDAKGDIVKWFGSCTDIDDWKRLEQTLRFLAQASQTFASARLDLQVILDTLTRLTSELTGDVCVLNLLSDDLQSFNHASCYHPDPSVRAFVGDLLERYPRRSNEGIGGRVMQTGEPLLIPITSQQEFSALIQPEYRLYLEKFHVRSALLVPLKIQGQPIGVLSLIRHAPGDPHTQDELHLFQDLADRAAMAIANARLYQQAEQARRRAERNAERTTRLQAVTAALSESLTPVQVAEVIAQQTIAVVGAASVLVALVTSNQTEVEIIHCLGDMEEIPPQWRCFSLNIDAPLTEAIRTKQPVWEATREERMARYPHLAQAYATARYPVWLSLPLIAEGQAVGGMTITFVQMPQLDPDDRALILALAQQCAQAIVRAQLYEAEQRARTQAEAANRMKDEFLAVLSHELRTPMNPILGWARLLQQGTLNPKQTAIALDTIERNAKLQVQLIEDLLDISRILQGKLRLNSDPVNLASTIDAALETVRLAAEAKQIHLQACLNPTINPVLGDAVRLQQVIWNLLTNAVKFTPSGGSITVQLSVMQQPQLSEPGQPACSVGSAQIQIIDTGQGINPQFLPHVFDTFRQADSSITRSFGGLGLGLAIARHIVELHGGTIHASSPGEGQGATFTVQLPLSPTLMPVQEVTLADQHLTLQGIQILAVDDELDNLELATFILEQAGATVMGVSSAAAALQQFHQTKPDLVLADIGMPEMDGYMLLQRIRLLEGEHSNRPTPAIALTAYASELDQQQALAAGFQRHMPKPVEPELLLQTIVDLVYSSEELN